MYEYLCDHCGNQTSEPDFRPIGELRLSGVCPLCGGLQRRAASMPAISRGMEEHFNHAVGRPIRSDAQFRSELARKSDELSERTGTDHKFAPIDYRDREACGVTEEGLDTTAKRMQDSGETESTRRIIV